MSRKTSVSHLSVTLSLAVLAAAPAFAGTVSDSFSATHNYSTGNTAGTIWSGIQINGAPVSATNGSTTGATIQQADANTTSINALTFTTTGGQWEFNNDTGILLYLTATGDFTATVKVSAPYVDYNTAGIMARNAASNTTHSENWIGAQFLGNFGFGQSQRTETNGIQNTTASNQNTSAGYLMLTRTANVYDTYFSSTGNAGSYIQMGGDYTNPALDGNVQLGLYQATYSDNSGTATFSDFSASGPGIAAAPEPSQSAIFGFGLLGLSGLSLRARRHNKTAS